MLAWARVKDPDRRRRGIVYIAAEGCLVHWTTGADEYVFIAWPDLASWGIVQERSEGPLLCLETTSGQTVVKLPALTRRMAENVASFLASFGEIAPWPERAPNRLDRIGPFEPVHDVSVSRERRSVPGYTKRILVTLLGSALVVLGIVLSLPLVPGPGLLTIIAGLAVLSTEFDFATDALDWARERYRATKRRVRGRSDRPKG